ncbi:hypothetical protein V7x_18660 [Crateriforma conspicua]|uniref:Uncharacterized protein n=1 Tax=Crateriforma conspicua TaxID=2527996 RepID=A0A5C6FTB1_9PLAN|nr:hypothetical protein [Crateriforma conspicua]TWU66302.1 hypothetical protein V7x_18660 [Crateriforma conspicua]
MSVSDCSNVDVTGSAPAPATAAAVAAAVAVPAAPKTGRPASEDADPNGPGQLLAELEARQDQALAELEALEKRLIDVMRRFGATPIEDEEAARKSKTAAPPVVIDDQTAGSSESTESGAEPTVAEPAVAESPAKAA